MGFLADFICFIIPAAIYGTLTTPGSGIKVFQFLYFFSSFWNQYACLRFLALVLCHSSNSYFRFGPNATTVSFTSFYLYVNINNLSVQFLVAAECYPASVRSTAHGFSAAWGKLGALAPAILYNYIGSHIRFWVVPWFGLLGIIITEVFLPDTTGLDLREQERYWQCVTRSSHFYYNANRHLPVGMFLLGERRIITVLLFTLSTCPCGSVGYRNGICGTTPSSIVRPKSMSSAACTSRCARSARRRRSAMVMVSTPTRLVSSVTTW
jgi:hypothetical protein